MKKISAVILDLIGNSMQWLDNNANEEHLEICEILTLDESSPIPIYDLNKYDNWDILLVFEQGVRDRIAHLLERIGIEEERILYPLDAVGSLYEKKEIASYIFSYNIGRLLEYISCRRVGEKYSMASVEGCTYINAATDNMILPNMIMTRMNWAQKDMRSFLELSNKYFVFDKKQEFFCDIGANIGTTCIYFKRMLDKDIRIMAFEPSPENYKLLKINLLLNDIDPFEHLISNCGLSDMKENGFIGYNPTNPGGSSLLKDRFGIKEEVKLISFDDYLEENSIDPGRLKYLWIDVEGYEARFLAGARKTLEKTNIPMFMEFVPRFYMEKEGEFDKLINELELHFKYYIIAGQTENGKIPLEKLREEQYNTQLECDLFLLKE